MGGAEIHWMGDCGEEGKDNKIKKEKYTTCNVKMRMKKVKEYRGVNMNFT